jgi:hypothetical protein
MHDQSVGWEWRAIRLIADWLRWAGCDDEARALIKTLRPVRQFLDNRSLLATCFACEASSRLRNIFAAFTSWPSFQRGNHVALKGDVLRQTLSQAFGSLQPALESIKLHA